MKTFKDLGIQSSSKTFIGKKIEIDEVLNCEIVVHEYRIVDSIYNTEHGNKCLHIQISLEGVKRVIFTGSKGLMDLIQQINAVDFPFTTTVKRVKENRKLEFT